MPVGKNSLLGRVSGDPRATSRLASQVLILSLVVGFGGGSLYLLPRLGVQYFLFVLVGIVVGGFYLYLSFRSLAIPLYIAILSIGGFRFLVSVQAPMLPDLYLDRLMILWLLVVFMIKMVVERRRLKPPYGLDLLLLAHGLYIFVRIWMDDFIVFNPYSRSIIEPYLIYFFAKNIITNYRQIRVLFFLLLMLGLYYSVTSIAQKYHWDFLLYPTFLRANLTEFVGRSIGPFGNPAVFGSAMGMILPLNLYFMARTRSLAIKILLYANISLAFAGLYFTYTRGPWLATAVGLCAVLALNFRNYVRPLIPALVLVPIVAISFLGLGQDKFMKERVEEEGTIGARLGTAVTALRVWRDNPLIGCGYFRYRIVRQKYVEPVDISGFETIRFVQYRDNPLHDMILGPLAEDGLIGFGLMMCIYFMIGRIFWKWYSKRGEGSHVAVFIIPLFVGVFVNYLVGGMTISYRYFAVLGTLLFVMVGIAAGFPEESDRSEMKP